MSSNRPKSFVVEVKYAGSPAATIEVAEVILAEAKKTFAQKNHVLLKDVRCSFQGIKNDVFRYLLEATEA